MALKAVNDSLGPEGLVPTLLVFRVYPRISYLDLPAPLIAQRATAIQKAITKIVKVRAKMTTNNALNTRNSPDIQLTHDLTIDSNVLV